MSALQRFHVRRLDRRINAVVWALHHASAVKKAFKSPAGWHWERVQRGGDAEVCDALTEEVQRFKLRDNG